MRAELQNRFIERGCNTITKVEIPSRCRDNILPIRVRIKIGVNQKLEWDELCLLCGDGWNKPCTRTF